MTTTQDTGPTIDRRIWKRRWFRRMVIIGSIPPLAIAWWLGSPLFIDRTVDEAFPTAATIAETPRTAQATTPAAAQPTTPTTTPASTPATTPVMTLPTTPPTPAASDAPSPTTTVPDGPIELAVGSFVGADAVHHGTGTATIYDVAGAILLRFEDFEVRNGPDLRVNLVMADGSMIDLGELTGNVGNQNYDVPADVDPSAVESVLIYCRAFSVQFAEATLA